MSDYSNQAQFDFSNKLAKYTEENGVISEREEAILYAQSVELQLLKAPQTAVFPPLEQFRVTEANGSYIVSGHVDSQNSYGASVRTPFSLTVTKNSGVWSCSNKFVSTSSSIGAQMVGHTILYWILGIIGTAILFAISSCSMSSMF